MKRTITTGLLFTLLFSCAHAIRKDLREQATRNVSIGSLLQNPELYKGHLFIFGGIIVSTKATSEGSEIEAIYVPVDDRGHLEEMPGETRRYMAIYPKSEGFLDPEIYKKNREITIAGVFTGVRTGKIGDMEYRFPVFEIKQIHLWSVPQYAYPPYPYFYPNYPYYPWWGSPWWGGPYYPWGPWRGPYWW